MKKRLTFIYGEQIASHGWFAVPHSLMALMGLLLKDTKLTPQEAYTLMILLRLKYRTGIDDPHISYRKLGTYLGVEARRMRDIINSLEQKHKLIARGRRRSGSRANVYDLRLLMDKLQSLYPGWAASLKKPDLTY